MKAFRLLWCYLVHRQFHTVTLSQGLPWPIELLGEYDWWCPRCDKLGGHRPRTPALRLSGQVIGR